MGEHEARAPGVGETGAALAADDLHDRRLALVFGLGALVGFVLLGLVWATVSAVSSGPERPVGRASGAGIFSDSPHPVDRTRGPSRLQRCANEAAAMAAPLRAAGPTLDQWQVHVGAMNKLVVGAITLQQATAFWNQTRVGAKRLIAAFHRADRVPHQRDSTCPVRRARAGLPSDLRSCVQQVRADDLAVAAARTAVHTWEMHVGDMERLRSGKLSPTAATTMWLSMWQRGIQELRAFHVADRRAQHQTGCTAAAG